MLVTRPFDGLIQYQPHWPAAQLRGTGGLARAALRTRVIEHEADFERLDRPWSALAADCKARPFQDFAWARAWIRTIGRTDGRQLRIATLWDKNRKLDILTLLRRSFFCFFFF